MGRVVVIRPAVDDDLDFLTEMWHLAAFWDPERFVLPLDDALALPELAHYIAGWGRDGDVALLAVEDGTGARLGAAWYRTFTGDDPGYGYVADDVPELAIAVVAGARRRGVGAALLDALLAEAERRATPGLSLSVSHGNPSRRLYERAGFVEVGDDGDSATMVRRFSEPA
jgi:ribosomal protein S18 acetylase RimI-like enzyme